MLDVMRNKAQTWVIKILFAVIILVFIFFFGYTQMDRNSGGNSSLVARVNGEAIPYGAYKLSLEDMSNLYEKTYKDKMTEEIMSQIRSAALYKIINQALFVQFAKNAGFDVTPVELFERVSKDPSLQKDGVFDVLHYKNVVLPFFEQRFGISYEILLREDLLAQKATDFITSHVSVSEMEAKKDFMKEKSEWTFERIKIERPPEENTAEDTAASPGYAAIANEVLAAMTSGNKGGLNKLIKKYDLISDKLEGITIDERLRLIPEDPKNPAVTEILSLTIEEPVVTRPVQAGNKFYLFKLTGIKKPTDEEWTKEKEAFTVKLTNSRKQDYLRQWQKKLKEDAKIEEYLFSQK